MHLYPRFTRNCWSRILEYTVSNLSHQLFFESPENLASFWSYTFLGSIEHIFCKKTRSLQQILIVFIFKLRFFCFIILYAKATEYVLKVTLVKVVNYFARDKLYSMLMVGLINNGEFHILGLLHSSIFIRSASISFF